MATPKLIEQISGMYETNEFIFKFMLLTMVIVNNELSSMGTEYSVLYQKNELVSREFLLNYHEKLMKYYAYNPTLFTDKLEKLHEVNCLINTVF